MENVLKNAYLIISLWLIIAISSCMPSPPPKNKSNNGQNKQKEISPRNTQKSKKETNNVESAEELALKQYNENVKLLAESAVRVKTRKNNTHKNGANTNKNPFEKRQEKLKNITFETDRFLDTTYYILKMEADSTEVITNVIVAGATESNNTEYFEKLIKSFDSDVLKYERTEIFDCANFLMYSNQFDFNDSLMQKALYHYGDCCFFNDHLDEAIDIFEKLSKIKLNRNIAPLVLHKLGQIYCIKGEKSKADKTFKRLKKEFPKHQLAKYSDCSRM